MPAEPPVLLIVDDSDNDVFLATRALRSVRADLDVRQAAHGADALSYLRRQGAHADAPLPDLILLDLNMPVMRGEQFLTELRSDEQLRHLVVIVMSTAEDPTTIRDAYTLGANGYLVKPMGYFELKEQMGRTLSFWFSSAALP